VLLLEASIKDSDELRDRNLTPRATERVILSNFLFTL